MPYCFDFPSCETEGKKCFVIPTGEFTHVAPLCCPSDMAAFNEET
jgi:hypothetical protein